MKKENIIIIGMRGVGKSTVGRALAKRLKFRFIDIDDEIERREGLKIKEIVEREGWESFREKETEFLKYLLEKETKKAVISCGGGIVLKEINRRYLKRLGAVFYLKANLESLLKRAKFDDKRPPISSNDLRTELETLLKQRESYYKNLADFTINTDNKTLEEVVYEMEQIWRTV